MAQNISIYQLMEKFKSKKEFYRFLQQDCKAYLPKIGSANIYFFKQILQGQKEYISRDKVKISSAPHIEGLTVQDFLNYARQNPQLLKYLPDERDWVHLERQWICDILYSIDQEQFQNFIDNAIKQRNEKMELQQHLSLQIKPEFVQALNDCKQFSRKQYEFGNLTLDEKGRSIFLIKDSSKRKRTRNELEEVKSEEEELKQNKQIYLREHKRLKTEKEQLEIQLQNFNNNQILLNQLLDAGIINEDGDLMIQQQFQI